MSSTTPEPRYCTIYLRPEQSEQQSAQEIKTLLQSKQIEDKIRGLKHLIYNISNDDNFDRMTMTVINTLTPLQTDNHNLKKILLFYWEVIEKLNKEGKLKDEMFLVCNSLRSDLLHPNEYLRGRTLRLVSRIMHKGILEPLISSIMEGLNHKHTYVRKNAIVAIYQIFLHFGDELISDIDSEMEKVLNNENDLSTKRNAFLLLFHTNQQKAMDYLYQQILDDRVDDMGDIMQLSVLELFRKTCKQDPTQKQRLMKAILYFQKSKSPSVQFECANTLTQLSNSPNTLKLATSIYVQILLNNTENNVKMVILDKLMSILAIEPKFLEEQLVDITKILNTQSFQIRKKTIEIIQVLLNAKNITIIFPKISKEVKKAQQEENKEYIKLLLDFVEYSVNNFEQVVDEAMNLINEQFLTSSKASQKNQDQIKNILNSLIINYPQCREKLISKILEKFYDIKSLYIFKGVLWILGEYATEDSTELSLQEIIRSVGTLPIEYIGKTTEEEKNNKDNNNTVNQAKESTTTQKKYKTVILADGTYGTELVVDQKQEQEENEEISKLKIIISQNAYIGSILARCALKLILKLKNNMNKFNKYSSQILLILCSLLRLYTKNQTIYEQDSVEKIHFSIKLLTNPSYFTQNKVEWLENQLKVPKLHKSYFGKQNTQQENKRKSIQKQPDDLIVIRALKSQKMEVDLSDDELGDFELKKQEHEEGDFVKKLGKLIQLTGYSDPIYAESFVHIHKYDIQFETLLINRTSKPLQKVQIDFFTQQSDIKRVIEKAQAVTLQPNGFANVKTSLKFSSSDIGVIFGAINYENIAGIEQAYLITKEIDIDLIDFIYPSEIDLNTFRELWAKYEWENRITLNPSGNDLYQFVNHIREHFKLYLLNDEEEIKNANCICANFYAKTKLDDDFLINLSAEIINNKINGYARIRSKAKGIVVNLGSKFKM